jgi:hypothetical protein
MVSIRWISAIGWQNSTSPALQCSNGQEFAGKLNSDVDVKVEAAPAGMVVVLI